jgi:hypothetical protein
MRIRLWAALTAICVLGVTASVALAASTLSLDAPVFSNEGDPIAVHVSGTAGEAGLAWFGSVRKEACPATRLEAQQQSTTTSNERSLSTGPFAFDAGVITRTTDGQPLTGFVNVCTYLYRTADGATLATATASVQLKPAGTPAGGFGMQISARQRMSSSGAIHMSATCPAGCTVKVQYTGVTHHVKLLTKHLAARSSPVTISLPLDAATQKLVKKARKKHKTVQVPVTATAKPSSGSRKTVSRKVSVG